MNAIECTQPDTGERIQYRLVNSGAIIISFETSANEVFVPASLDGHPVIGIDDSSFARTFTLKRVALPQGLTSIGKDAFKSCVSLAEVVLPDTLQSVASGVFRSTALESLAIPASCTNVEDDSFSLLGSWKTPPSTIRPNSLKRIAVAPENPVLVMEGGILCRRIEGGLRGITCPNAGQHVTLSGQIVSVSPAAFSGVVHVPTLRLSERLRATTRDTVFPGTSCDTLVVECKDKSVMSLSMPSEEVARKTLAKLFRAQTLNIEQALSTFDDALSTVRDFSALSRSMLDRLSYGHFSSNDTEKRYRKRITSSLDATCLEFATSSYWKGFDQLLECGLLNEGNVMHAIDILSQYEETAAVGYLLQAKQKLFGKAVWDYGI